MKKKICFLTESIFTIGGVQRVTAVIAKAMAADYDVTILTFDKPESRNLALYGLEQANLHFRFFAYPPAGRIERTLCRAYSGLYLKLQLHSQWTSALYGYSSFPPTLRKALIRELRGGDYDAIIGVHAPLAGRLATMKGSLQGVKLIGWIHNSYEALYGQKYLYVGAVRQRHYVYQFRKLHRVVLLCRHDVSAYKAYDPAFSPIAIYNPLTLQPGPPSAGSSKRFLAVGRFSYQHKGFDLLIEAFRLFAQTNHDWTLDIVGEGPEEAMLRSMIAKYGLQSRITIHPFTPHIQQYYSEAQVYVLSSRWEGMPLVLMEAMSHGLPVVSSSLPMCLEIMGSAALYFKNGDIDDLARQLDEATRIDWPLKSREAMHIVKKFDVDNIARQWKTLLEE